VVSSEILVMASPTWLGRPSSITQRALERMDAMLAETDDEEGRSPTTGSRGSSSPATRTAPTT
jgi:multimeric flavodoxin WrbA